MYIGEIGETDVIQFGQQPLPGSNEWSEMEPGIFHGWGFKVIEHPDGMVQQSCAIIEDPQGYTHLVEPVNFKFENPII